MRHDADDLTHHPLDDALRDALAALPRERVGSADMEARVVHTLIGNRLLEPRAHVVAVRALRLASIAAAALLLFTAGIAVGRKTAETKIAAAHTLADSAPVALLVQRTGTEFVNTLELIRTDADSTDPRVLAQGREVARSTLRAAARQVARVAPNDPVAALILESTRPESSTTMAFWF